ncbi:MAG TPA: hypothetical protein VKK81_20815, partial [Candidatus Binatia bacterium]|nr:hypothetical protein [Candidatus Binatia bacterium]
AQAKGKPEENGKGIPESLLVALSALQYRYEGRLDVAKGFGANMQGFIQEEDIWRRDGISVRSERPSKVLQETITDHEERFGKFYGLSSTEEYWKILQEMSKGIRV